MTTQQFFAEARRINAAGYNVIIENGGEVRVEHPIDS